MPTSLTPEALLADRRWIEELARKLVRDPNTADDVAQEAWRRALERPPGRLTSPRGWLHSLVKSCARELRRSDTRRAVRERAASRPEATSGAADLVARADAQRRVLAAVLALEPDARDAVLLRYFEDLEPWEIARRLGEPQGTVRSRLHRALAVLRTRLDGEYGGDRGAWSVALCGPGWRQVAPSSGTAAVTKGVLVMTTQAKVAVGAAVIAALLLCFWKADGAETTTPVLPKPEAETKAAVAPRVAPARRASETEETATTVETAAAPTAAATPAVSGPKRLTVKVVEHTAPDTSPDVGLQPGGRSGEITDVSGPAGGIEIGGGVMLSAGWTKWKPVPEKGTATLRGKVTDARGAPLAGAEVLRVEAAAGGADGDVRDFSHIVKVGETGADGTFTLDEQPARAYRLAANWHFAMSRPPGVLFGGLVSVEPHEKETVSGIELRLPIDAADFGTVTGRVVDDEGSPVETDVEIGWLTAHSGTDGRFRLTPVAAGDREVDVNDYDYRPYRGPVTVRAGTDVEVEVRLTQKLPGPHEIDGVVKDGDGKPVANATIFLGGVPDVYRRQRTGPDGSFRFRRVPLAPAGAGHCLTVFGDGIVLTNCAGVVAPSHGVVVQVERSAKVTLRIRDAATGAALPTFNVTIEQRKTANGRTYLEPVVMTSEHEESGSWTAEVPRGELVLFVEAPDHRGLHGEIVVPRDDAEFEALIELQR